LGSFLKVADPDNKLAVSGNFSLMAFIWPTMPHRGSRQTILGRWDTLRNKGYALGINPLVISNSGLVTDGGRLRHR